MRDKIKIEELQAQIEAGVTELVGAEDWQQWLSVAARFPKYSFRNQLLILAQRVDARAVMGYRAWQALGHQVRKGESSIKILAPCTYKAKRSGDEDRDHDDEQPARKVLRGFRLAHVFDPLSRDLTPGISGSWRWQNRPGGTTTWRPCSVGCQDGAVAERRGTLG